MLTFKGLQFPKGFEIGFLLNSFFNGSLSNSSQINVKLVGTCVRLHSGSLTYCVTCFKHFYTKAYLLNHLPSS